MQTNSFDIQSNLLKIEQLFNPLEESDLNSKLNYSIKSSFTHDPNIMADTIIIGELINDSFIKSISNETLKSEDIMKTILIRLKIANFFIERNLLDFKKNALEDVHLNVQKFIRYFNPRTEYLGENLTILCDFFIKNGFIENEIKLIQLILIYLTEMNDKTISLIYLLKLKNTLPKEVIKTQLHLTNIEDVKIQKDLLTNPPDELNNLIMELELFKSISEMGKFKDLIFKNKMLIYNVNKKSVLKEFLSLKSDKETREIIESMTIENLNIDYKSVYFSSTYFDTNFVFFNNVLTIGLNNEHLQIIKSLIYEKINNDFFLNYMNNKDTIDHHHALSFVMLLYNIGLHKEAHEILHSLINVVQGEMKTIFDSTLIGMLQFFKDLRINKEAKFFNIITKSKNINYSILEIITIYCDIKRVYDVINDVKYSRVIKTNIDTILSYDNLFSEKNDSSFDKTSALFHKLKIYQYHNLIFYVKNKVINELEKCFTAIFSFIHNIGSNKCFFDSLVFKMLREIAYLRYINSSTN
jgi:hypothetical protein